MSAALGPRDRNESLPSLKSVLIVDPDRTMGTSHRTVLEAAGYTCSVAAGVSSALEALDQRHFECLVIGLHKHAIADSLLEALMARPVEARGFGRLIGVRFDEDPSRLMIGLAAIVVKPTPPAALAATIADDVALPDLGVREMSLLVESHGLGRGGEALERVAATVREAFGAAAAVVITDVPRLACVASDAPTADAKLAARVLEAADAGVPLVMGALATANDAQSYEHAFETVVAVGTAGGGHCPRVVMGVVFEGAVRKAHKLAPILAGLARRIAEERGVQGVQDRLAAELDAVREVGGLDPVLGVWNRSALGRLLEMMETARRRTGEPLAIAVLNVMGMTRINDTHGHREGDALLRHVAEVAMYVVRGSDVVARYHGDDLAIVFQGATAKQAIEVTERIQHTIASQPLRTDDGQEIQIATTAGVTALTGPEDDGEKALARAAKAAARGNEQSAVVTAFFDAGEDETAAVSVKRALDGVTFGGSYRVLHEIGAGGGGGVFRGEDLGLRRPVAIKILRSEQSQNAELVERFRGEAATLAALRHPNLVQVYAFGLEDGHAYFVMELVEGESLFDAVVRSRRESQPIPLRRVQMVLAQIISALRTLHHAGIIHRDVKPANILLDPFRDRAVLVDVGIARRQGERASLAGTPGYMAPEAATSVDLDASADIYGLAVTLYELLTLELPWPIDNDPLRTIQNQRSNKPKPPSAHDPALAPLDAPLLRAMSLVPSERWRNVDAFGAAMNEAFSRLEAASSARSEPVTDSDPSGFAIAHAPTVVWKSDPGEDEPSTRGVVFRALPRVIGARDTAAWRLELGANVPRLAEALSPATLPLGWLPTRLLVELVMTPPSAYPRADTLGRDLGRASVRATFRRFFPAAAVTLAPAGTLSALPSIWPRYHSWGSLRVVPHVEDRMTVVIQKTPGVPCLCEWTTGALEQLVLMSGGDTVEVRHEVCEARGGAECAFDVRWKWDPASNRSWRTA